MCFTKGRSFWCMKMGHDYFQFVVGMESEWYVTVACHSSQQHDVKIPNLCYYSNFAIWKTNLIWVYARLLDDATFHYQQRRTIFNICVAFCSAFRWIHQEVLTIGCQFSVQRGYITYGVRTIFLPWRWHKSFFPNFVWVWNLVCLIRVTKRELNY